MTENNFSIPYIVYESSEAKHERTVKRLIILLAITIFLMFATNIFWMLIFCSYDYTGADTETNSFRRIRQDPIIFIRAHIVRRDIIRR